MAEGIYEKLREHLDSLPTGYPKTQSGVELKILQKLFTQEEAEMACQLKLVPETAEQVAERLGRNPKTGETIQIPAKTVVKFRVAKAAKEAILVKK